MMRRCWLVGVDLLIVTELGPLPPRRDGEGEVLCVLVILSERQGSWGPRKHPGDVKLLGGWDDIHIPKGQRKGLLTARFLEKLL